MNKFNKVFCLFTNNKKLSWHSIINFSMIKIVHTCVCVRVSVISSPTIIQNILLNGSMLFSPPDISPLG